MAYSNWGDAFWSGANKGAEFGSFIQDRYYNTKRNQAIAEAEDQFNAEIDAANARRAAADAVRQEAIQEGAQGIASTPAQNIQSGGAPSPTGTEQTGPYQYDADTREKMREAAVAKRDRALRSAFNNSNAADKADTYLQSRDKTESSQMDQKNRRIAAGVWEQFSSGEWTQIPGIAATMQSAADTLGSYTGTNFGKFKIENGKVYNNTGKGWVELPQQALNMVKRATAAEIIGMKTGDWSQTKEFLDSMTKMEDMGNKKEALRLKGQAIAQRGARGNGVGKLLSDSQVDKLLASEDYRPVFDKDNRMWLEHIPSGSRAPTGRFRDKEKTASSTPSSTPTTPTTKSGSDQAASQTTAPAEKKVSSVSSSTTKRPSAIPETKRDKQLAKVNQSMKRRNGTEKRNSAIKPSSQTNYSSKKKKNNDEQQFEIA